MTRVNYVTDFATRRRARRLLLQRAPTQSTFPFDATRPRVGPMYISVTRDIQVTALPDFLPRAARTPPTIVSSGPIRSRSPISARRRVQLLSRHWIIIDAYGRREEVKGPGVVGEQPVLEPGETFRYASGCPLSTPSGTDEGKLYDDHPPRRDLRHRGAGLLAGQPALQADAELSGTCAAGHVDARARDRADRPARRFRHRELQVQSGAHRLRRRSYLRAQGVPFIRAPNATGDKAALFATIGPPIDGGVVLSGHTDVVPVTGQNWTADPFAAASRGRSAARPRRRRHEGLRRASASP